MRSELPAIVYIYRLDRPALIRVVDAGDKRTRLRSLRANADLISIRRHTSITDIYVIAAVCEIKAGVRA